MPTPDLDLLVLGSGVAGLSAAVRAASVEPGLRVGVLTKADLSQSTTRWAQGGVAAVLGVGTGRDAGIDNDSTDLHLADSLRAGAGLCDVDAVRVLVDEGPGRVEELIALGAVFDTDGAGHLLLAREGGHSLPRVVHAGGAATGIEVERALVEAVRATAAGVFEHWLALDLLVAHGRCRGVTAVDPDGRREELRASHVLLATGGAGQLFAVTTNPAEATGDGLAMALRAHVAVADVEFMQFHPTALHHPAMPRPLLSEALRGHGALLRDARGERFVDELLPRDLVSRSMAARMLDQGVEHLWLDATGLEGFDERFPTIAAAVREVGLDPASDWLPIAPAAHHLCGGLLTDLDGASALPGLWAAGEVACSGVHGANRLASNSLLEGMVFGTRVVDALCRGKEAPEPTGAMRAILGGAVLDGDRDGPWIPGRTLPLPPATRHDDVGGTNAQKQREELQRVMTAGAGVLRSADSLADTGRALDRLGPIDDPEVGNLVTNARALLAAATAREETRGAHARTDHVETRDELRLRLVIQ